MVPPPPSVIAAPAPAAAGGGAPNAAATAGGKMPTGLAGLFDGLLRSAAVPAANHAPKEPIPQPIPGDTRAQPAQAIRTALPAADAAPDAQTPVCTSPTVAHGPELAQPAAGLTPADPGAPRSTPRGSAAAVQHPPSDRARPRAAGETSAPSVPTPALADPTQIVVAAPPPLPPSASATAVSVSAEPFPPAGGATISTVASLPARQSSEPAIAATEAAQTDGPAAKAPSAGTPPAAPASLAVAECPAPASPVLVTAAQPASLPVQTVSVPAGAASAQTVPPAAQLQPVLMHIAAPPHGPQAITVSLHPAELGQVEVRVERGETGSVQVALTADRPETLHALVRDQGQLNDALGRAGVPPDARSLTFHLAQPEPPASPSVASAGFSPGTDPQPQPQPQGGAWPAGAASDTQAQGGQGQGGQGRAGQDGGRYRPTHPLTGEAGEAPGDAQGARWLRLGIDITA